MASSVKFIGAFAAAVGGFSLIWLSIDSHDLVAGIAGGLLFGGGVTAGVLGRW
jgi:hypothetical protein